jgi:glutamate-1-semialdehyde 2,1-aminomutase
LSQESVAIGDGQEREMTGALLGGISSQFRVNPFTGEHLEVRRANGAVIQTTDGREYIDMFMAHGSTALGHAHPDVIAAIKEILGAGVIVGYETGLGEDVATRITEVVPSAEAVRFVASGSEAVSTTMRLCRAHTGRDIILKIDGHFNGGSDYAVINSMWTNTDSSNPGGQPSRPILSSNGVPQAVVDTVVPVPWNDIPALEATLATYRDRVAAVIMVPIDYNNGCIVPNDGYLAQAQELVHNAGGIVVFDEVLSGFKTGLGCAQGLYGVTPDVTLLSKALSSGVPLSAIAGRAEVMSTFMVPLPKGALQGGTYAGNIIGLAAAQSTLNVLTEPDFYPHMQSRADHFYAELQAMFDASPLPARVQGLGCMFGLYIGTRDPVTSYGDIRALDRELTRRFFAGCIEQGLYFHTDFSVSAAHTTEILAQVVERMEKVASQVH